MAVIKVIGSQLLNTVLECLGEFELNTYWPLKDVHLCNSKLRLWVTLATHKGQTRQSGRVITQQATGRNRACVSLIRTGKKIIKREDKDFNQVDVWTLPGLLQRLDSFPFQSISCKFAAVLGNIVLLHNSVSVKLYLLDKWPHIWL